MDFKSAMETFAEAWVAANTKTSSLSDTPNQNQAMALTKRSNGPIPSTSLGISSSTSTQIVRSDSIERTSTPAPPHSNASHESEISPPSVKDESDHFKCGKTLSVHCIVESLSFYEDKGLFTQIPQQGVWRKRPHVDSDSYVIIPVDAPFHALVQMVLVRLGYTADMISTAKGSVLIKNWKSLSVDQITDDPLVTVGEILGELTTVATLRIQVLRSRFTVFTDIKDKLLQFFLTRAAGLLLTTCCPLDETFLGYLFHGACSYESPPELTEETRRKFEHWYNSKLGIVESTNRVHVAPQQTTVHFTSPVQTSKSHDRSLSDTEHTSINAHNQFATQKTRMRTSFDPELELPKLQRWFADNQHPSRQQIQQYVKELNNLESRRGRKPLDVNNVVYWFKNARAAQKRAEIRNITPSLPCHLTINGYNDHNTNGVGALISERYTDRSINPHIRSNMPISYRYSTPGSDDLSCHDEDNLKTYERYSPTTPPFPATPKKENCSESSGYRYSPECMVSPTTTTAGSKETSSRALSPPTQIQEENLQPELNNSCGSNNLNVTSDKEETSGGEEVKVREDSPVQPSQGYCDSPPPADFERISTRPPADGLERLGFPLVPNSMFSQSIMYMSHYIPGLAPHAGAPVSPGVLGMSVAASALSADERRKRNRTFIDPVTEVPRLEQWFSVNTHPSHHLIMQYTEDLNCMAYRQKFPKLEPKNVQFWFKNRRAKCKRLKMSLFDSQAPTLQQYRDRDRE